MTAARLREAAGVIRRDIATMSIGPAKRSIAWSEAANRLRAAGFNPANTKTALALADWLDATASTEASYFDDSAALAVADAILGDAS